MSQEREMLVGPGGGDEPEAGGPAPPHDPVHDEVRAVLNRLDAGSDDGVLLADVADAAGLAEDETRGVLDDLADEPGPVTEVESLDDGEESRYIISAQSSATA